MSDKPKRDVYAEVTDRLVRLIEAGTVPWSPEWSGGGGAKLPVRATGQPYRGVNILLLWASAVQQGFQSNRWLTLRQANSEGGRVKKGEKSSTCLFFREFHTKEVDKRTGKPKKAFVARAYGVFNTDQCENVLEPPKAEVKERNPDDAMDWLDVDAALAVGADVRHGPLFGPCYRPALDRIEMPSWERFHNGTAYYSTLAHELGHWTGHLSRLDRHPEGWQPMGTPAYSKEELVAEMCAAFTMARLGVPYRDERSASYLAAFVKMMKADSRVVVQAASAASAAADYLAGKTAVEEPDDDSV